MRLSLLVAVVLVIAPELARADVGLGFFFGQPTGVDLKLGLGPRTGLDLLAGFHDYNGGSDYGHVTYLVTPAVGRGESVLVPFRVGIGVAVLDSGRSFGDDLHVAVRAPLEVGLRFRHVPLEIYGEISAILVFQHDPSVDLDGGIGLRIYF
jgi:hypothetical protein